jgi:hypothetical protein
MIRQMKPQNIVAAVLSVVLPTILLFEENSHALPKGLGFVTYHQKQLL